MKISYSWLKNYLEIDLEAEKTAEILTDLGLEVEGLEEYESVKGSLKGVVVGEVLTCEKHPNADRLSVTTVDVGGGEPLQIVCGAPNVRAGQKVPVATIGTVLYDKQGKAFEIKEGKIRGEVSRGMICAEDELGLGDSHEGIMVLSEDIPVGTPAAEVFGVTSDPVFEIGLTPNRADAMSHMGVARDLAARLRTEKEEVRWNAPDVSAFRAGEGRPVEVTVEDPQLAPRYAGIVIRNLQVEPSPDWLQKYLRAIGLSPINNVVDITNFILHDLGQPLHAFDLRQVGDRIRVGRCAEGTPFVTLDGVERKLSDQDLMICNAEKPMCMAGIFGGEESGIKPDTKDIFLESAYFNPVSIRRSSKRHGIQTDASFRYERGIDPNITVVALKKAALMLCQIAHGEIASEVIDIDSGVGAPFEFELRPSHVTRLLGQQIPLDTIKKILHNLEVEIVRENEDSLWVKVPAYRVDVQREADLVEDILRVYGYNRIEVSDKLTTSLVSGDKFNAERMTGIASDMLASMGFNEMMSTSLTKGAYTAYLEELDPQEDIHILNPLSSDLDTMRRTMLFSGLEAVARNINFKNSDLALFESGKTYCKTEKGYNETRHLALFMTGNRSGESWTGQPAPTDFFYLKGVVENLLGRFGLDRLKTKPASSAAFSEGIVLCSGKTPVAVAGKVDRRILKKFDIRQDVFYADVLWEEVLKKVRENRIEYRDLPKYPSVRRDLALLLDQSVRYEDLYLTAFQTERNLLKEVNLFDVYQGDKLPEGKKSYAMSFILQDDSRTLDDSKIEAVMGKLFKAFEKQFGAALR